MRYLINKKTKEHVVCGDGAWDSSMWTVVHGDADGWIKHDGSIERPLPDNHPFEFRFSTTTRSDDLGWSVIGFYRPILDSKPETETDPVGDPDDPEARERVGAQR